MQQQPLSPAPDVDQALLVRMAMDMDWPPAPAVDWFVELAIERASSDLEGVPASEPPPRIVAPPRSVTMRQPGSRRPDLGKPGTSTAAVLAYLRDRKAPATASEIAAGSGVPRSHVHGLARHLIGKGAVRHIAMGRLTAYEATDRET